ncbi:hypothetical protein CAEBREN_13299 [Caenorhabditis brenneri]|uniref:DUF7107 domain-containing protein n=1 Tax=Caenorhabditis brenneri TaxID=135651 RepID=G0N5K0_CAEBE|nr:hypothetical protein CAEBREN_13299 [Caenorhabditis brenneri]
MLLFLVFLLLTCQLSSGETEVNITSSEKLDNLTHPGKAIYIPSSSEEEQLDSEEISLETILSKAKEFDETTTPDIPYLPLIQRCSIDADCSSETACYDGKCINAKRDQLFPYMFQRCQSRLDCPSGHRCIISMCIPFRW